MTTLLFDFEFFRRDTAFASPIPIAVPSEISPWAAISVLVPFRRFCNEAWSTVIGHWVNASPAKIVRPILSFGRSAINSPATALAASIRLGFKSSASILVDTSIASMISMPSTVFSFHALRVCGRARAITMRMNAIHLSAIGTPISLTLQLTGAFL